MQYPTKSEYVKASQDASDNLDMSTKATDEELNEELNDPEESNIVEFVMPANMEAVNLEVQTSLDKLEEEAKQLKDTQQANLNTIAKSTLSQRFSSILSELF